MYGGSSLFVDNDDADADDIDKDDKDVEGDDDDNVVVDFGSRPAFLFT